MHVLDIDGLQIAYRVTGAGPPLVLAARRRLGQPHLAPADRGARRRVHRRRVGRARRRPLARPAGAVRHGRLGGRARRPARGARASGPPTWCGLSWGGTLALALYARAPEAVASLVLAGAYAGWKGSLSAEECAARLAAALASAALPPAELADALAALGS